MPTEKPQRSATPGSLLSQWWTMGAISRDSRARTRHLRAAWVILDRYMQGRGKGRASVRYISNAAGLSQRAVVSACRELTDWGYTRRLVGSGSRPSEYMPNWVTAPPATTRHLENDVASASPVDSTIATHGVHTNQLSASPVGSESDLQLTGLEAGLVVGEAVSASGPGAGAPAAAGDFERIWRAYGRYGNKQASRRAFAAITDPEIESIVERAAAWCASAKPGQRRMPLEKWLVAEKYDEADRGTTRKQDAVGEVEQGEQDVRRRRDTVDAAGAAEAARAMRLAAVDIRALRDKPLKVIDARLEGRGHDTWLVVDTDGGAVAIVVEGGQPALQDEGQAHLGRLSDACGVAVNEPGDLRGCTFMIMDDTFAAVAA